MVINSYLDYYKECFTFKNKEVKNGNVWNHTLLDALLSLVA